MSWSNPFNMPTTLRQLVRIPMPECTLVRDVPSLPPLNLTFSCLSKNLFKSIMFSFFGLSFESAPAPPPPLPPRPPPPLDSPRPPRLPRPPLKLPRSDIVFGMSCGRQVSVCKYKVLDGNNAKIELHDNAIALCQRNINTSSGFCRIALVFE